MRPILPCWHRTIAMPCEVGSLPMNFVSAAMDVLRTLPGDEIANNVDAATSHLPLAHAGGLGFGL